MIFARETEEKKKETNGREVRQERTEEDPDGEDYHRSISFPFFFFFFFPFLQCRASTFERVPIKPREQGGEGNEVTVVNRVNEKLLGKFAGRTERTEAIKHRECTEKRYGMIKTARARAKPVRAFASDRIEYALKV